MSHDLFLAQSHAFQLSRDLMVPSRSSRSTASTASFPPTSSTPATISRSYMNSSPGRRIEPAFAVRLPLASMRPQGRLRRGWRVFAATSVSCQPRPCPPLLFAADRILSANYAGKEREEDRDAIGFMNRKDIEELRDRVNCEVVLEASGFAVDRKESTRRAVKFRRGDANIIVTHEGRGWFDPLGDDKGDVFPLVSHLNGVGFSKGVERVATLVGFVPSEPVWRCAPIDSKPDSSILDRWNARPAPEQGSRAWRYLCWTRGIPANVVRHAIARGVLREGPFGSMWAAHSNERGIVAGWEERGPEWRGFATGGAKVLFRLGPDSALRLAVTEASIDATSLAAIEGLRDGTLYLSTGGGWSPTTEAALRELASRPGLQLVAATDANFQGDKYAERLRALASDVGCDWTRLRPPEEDWNETLKVREKERREKRQRRVPHSRRPRQGRLRPDEPALDPAGRDVGGSEGVMKD